MTTARKSHVVETPSRPAPALAGAGVRPAKSRGQNFLTNAGVADRIVAAADLCETDSIIESGPVLGSLTEKIVTRPRRSLTLVELDSRLAARLQERFTNVRVVNADFLEINFAALAGNSPVKVIGNLPFNGPAAILRRLFANPRLLSSMVLMFHREVAAPIRPPHAPAPYCPPTLLTPLPRN